MTYASHATSHNFSLVHNILYTIDHDQKSLFFQWARTHRDAIIESSSISTWWSIPILLKKGLPVATHRVHCEPGFRVVKMFCTLRTETLRYVEYGKVHVVATTISKKK